MYQWNGEFDGDARLRKQTGVEMLRAFGFSERVIKNLKSHTPWLIALQAYVATTTGLLRGKNVLVSAPTSSGKTLIGELAALWHLIHGRNSIFLVPTKAIAEQLYGRLTARYASLGIIVAIATRERTAHDDKIMAGHAHFTICVYEKFTAFMELENDMLPGLGLVVADEIQIVGDDERGPRVDLRLTELVNSPDAPQIVCLSAVLSEAKELAEWLRCELVEWTKRPVDLREGVVALDTGVLKYREVNSGVWGEEQLLPHPVPMPIELWHHDQFPAVAAVTRVLVERGEQVVIFVPTRGMAKEWGRKIGSTIGLGPATEALLSLEAYEETRSRKLMEECFSGSSACHSSEIPPEFRALIESEFNAGRIRVIVATSTLAEGVNLSAVTVIQNTQMIRENRDRGTVGPVMLSRRQFRNQGGRAGRLLDDGTAAFGRSILIAPNEFIAEQYERCFLRGELEPLTTAQRNIDVAPLALSLIHSRKNATAESVESRLLRMWCGRTHWSADRETFRRQLDKALAELCEVGAVQECDGVLHATRPGQSMAASGVRLKTLRMFMRYIDAVGGLPLHEFEVLLLCSFTEDGRKHAFPCSRNETMQGVYTRRRAEREDRRLDYMPKELAHIWGVKGEMTAGDEVVVKRALVAEDWLSEDATDTIERRWDLYAGMMANLGAYVGWLVQSLAACATAMDAPKRFIGELWNLGLRLPAGVQPDGIALARLGVTGLTRGYVAALVQNGYDSPLAVSQVGVEELRRWVPEPLARAVYEAARWDLRMDLRSSISDLRSGEQDLRMDLRSSISDLRLDGQGEGEKNLNRRERKERREEHEAEKDRRSKIVDRKSPEIADRRSDASGELALQIQTS